MSNNTNCNVSSHNNVNLNAVTTSMMAPTTINKSITMQNPTIEIPTNIAEIFVGTATRANSNTGTTTMTSTAAFITKTTLAPSTMSPIKIFSDRKSPVTRAPIIANTSSTINSTSSELTPIIKMKPTVKIRHPLWIGKSRKRRIRRRKYKEQQSMVLTRTFPTTTLVSPSTILSSTTICPNTKPQVIMTPINSNNEITTPMSSTATFRTTTTSTPSTISTTIKFQATKTPVTMTPVTLNTVTTSTMAPTTIIPSIIMQTPTIEIPTNTAKIFANTATRAISNTVTTTMTSTAAFITKTTLAPSTMSPIKAFSERKSPVTIAPIISKTSTTIISTSSEATPIIKMKPTIKIRHPFYISKSRKRKIRRRKYIEQQSIVLTRTFPTTTLVSSSTISSIKIFSEKKCPVTIAPIIANTSSTINSTSSEPTPIIKMKPTVKIRHPLWIGKSRKRRIQRRKYKEQQSIVLTRTFPNTTLLLPSTISSITVCPNTKPQVMMIPVNSNKEITTPLSSIKIFRTTTTSTPSTTSTTIMFPATKTPATMTPVTLNTVTTSTMAPTTIIPSIIMQTPTIEIPTNTAEIFANTATRAISNTGTTTMTSTAAFITKTTLTPSTMSPIKIFSDRKSPVTIAPIIANTLTTIISTSSEPTSIIKMKPTVKIRHPLYISKSRKGRIRRRKYKEQQSMVLTRTFPTTTLVLPSTISPTTICPNTKPQVIMTPINSNNEITTPMSSTATFRTTTTSTPSTISTTIKFQATKTPVTMTPVTLNTVTTSTMAPATIIPSISMQTATIEIPTNTAEIFANTATRAISNTETTTMTSTAAFITKTKLAPSTMSPIKIFSDRKSPVTIAPIIANTSTKKSIASIRTSAISPTTMTQHLLYKSKLQKKIMLRRKYNEQTILAPTKIYLTSTTPTLSTISPTTLFPDKKTAVNSNTVTKTTMAQNEINLSRTLTTQTKQIPIITSKIICEDTTTSTTMTPVILNTATTSMAMVSTTTSAMSPITRIRQLLNISKQQNKSMIKQEYFEQINMASTKTLLTTIKPSPSTVSSTTLFPDSKTQAKITSVFPNTVNLPSMTPTILIKTTTTTKNPSKKPSTIRNRHLLWKIKQRKRRMFRIKYNKHKIITSTKALLSTTRPSPCRRSPTTMFLDTKILVTMTSVISNTVTTTMASTTTFLTTKPPAQSIISQTTMFPEKNTSITNTPIISNISTATPIASTTTSAMSPITRIRQPLNISKQQKKRMIKQEYYEQINIASTKTLQTTTTPSPSTVSSTTLFPDTKTPDISNTITTTTIAPNAIIRTTTTPTSTTMSPTTGIRWFDLIDQMDLFNEEPDRRMIAPITTTPRSVSPITIFLNTKIPIRKTSKTSNTVITTMTTTTRFPTTTILIPSTMSLTTIFPGRTTSSIITMSSTSTSEISPITKTTVPSELSKTQNTISRKRQFKQNNMPITKIFPAITIMTTPTTTPSTITTTTPPPIIFPGTTTLTTIAPVQFQTMQQDQRFYQSQQSYQHQVQNHQQQYSQTPQNQYFQTLQQPWQWHPQQQWQWLPQQQYQHQVQNHQQQYFQTQQHQYFQTMQQQWQWLKQQYQHQSTKSPITK